MEYIIPPMAIEELKTLQSIISKHDDLRAQVLGWCVALITGLTVAYLSKPVEIDRWGFVALSVSIVLLFLWVSVSYKVAQDRAIERARTIESQIRAQATYDGPLVTDSLSRANRWPDQKKALNNVRVWGPFASLLLLVVLGAFAHR